MAESGHIWKLLAVEVGILRLNNAALLLFILCLRAAVGHSLLQDVSVPPLASRRKFPWRGRHWLQRDGNE